jgi:AcrR family transcriptional regulator
MTAGIKSEGRKRLTHAERSSQTKARLLEVTIELLIENGYARTSTNDVARRAGLSRGAQVHHFPRKVDLVIAAVEDLALKHRETLLGKMEKLPEDATRTEVALKSLWEVYRGPLYVAAMELRIAARTDPELKRAQARMYRTVVGPTHKDFITALVGPAARKDKALVEKLEGCAVFVSGLADARQDRNDAWCDRQIKFWAGLMTPIIEKARAGCRTQA